MNCDILVIGAGILGTSSAYYLKKQNPEKRILIIDKYNGPGQGNTAKCGGGFRTLFASKTNYLLADSSIDCFTHIQNDIKYDLKLSYIGYLYLLSDSKKERLKDVFNKMRAIGVKIKTFEKEELGHMIPNLVTDLDEDVESMGLESITFGLNGIKCGTMDADALTRFYESEFLKLGGEVRYNTTATKLILIPKKKIGLPGEPFAWQDTTIIGAETDRGIIEAERTIVAAGVWSERLLDPIGFDSMMRPKKRVMFVFKDPKLDGLFNIKGMNEQKILPFTQLPNATLYMKPDLMERSIWLAVTDGFGRKYGLEDDPQPEKNLYYDNIYHALVEYFPCFKDIRPINMWAGQREINSFDKLPIVAPAPGMIYIGAATGNGLMKSDALGRITAALYTGEKELELYGNRNFKVADLGIAKRNVEKEIFKP